MTEHRFSGLGVCAGIAFGKVHLVDRRRVSVPRYHVPLDKVELELERFEAAIVKSEAQLVDLIERAHAADLKEVQMLLEAHAMVLRDEAMRDATRRRIADEFQNAEWALKEEVKQIRQMFDGLDSEYFKERRSDVDVVSERVMRNLVGAETEFLDNLSHDAIVVAYDLSPADTVALARYAAKGFVTETGGRTSHTAILAKAMNVPAVLGVHGIMECAGFGDEILLDGGAGEVILAPTGSVVVRYQKRRRRREKEQDALRADRHLPAQTTDGVRIALLGNIEVSDEIALVLEHGGEGVGLYRTEFLVIERHEMPSVGEHATEYAKVVRELGDRPLVVRTVDIGGDKFVRSASKRDSDPPKKSESNPALGLRAIRISLRDTVPFKAQLKGALLASAEGDVRILLPLITSVCEVRQAKVLLEESKAELRAAGRPFNETIPLGAMIETPAAAAIADLIAAEVDFFSIGTNDLIQYSLAVDRGNDDVSYLYRPSSPAVLRLVKMAVDAGHAAGIEVTVCGEMAGGPFEIPLLLGLGVRSLSMSASSIPLAKRLIRRVSAQECTALVDEVLGLPTADDVEAAVAATIKRWESRRPQSLLTPAIEQSSGSVPVVQVSSK